MMKASKEQNPRLSYLDLFSDVFMGKNPSPSSSPPNPSLSPPSPLSKDVVCTHSSEFLFYIFCLFFTRFIILVGNFSFKKRHFFSPLHFLLLHLSLIPSPLPLSFPSTQTFATHAFYGTVFRRATCRRQNASPTAAVPRCTGRWRLYADCVRPNVPPCTPPDQPQRAGRILTTTQHDGYDRTALSSPPCVTSFITQCIPFRRAAPLPEQLRRRGKHMDAWVCTDPCTVLCSPTTTTTTTTVPRTPRIRNATTPAVPPRVPAASIKLRPHPCTAL